MSSRKENNFELICFAMLLILNGIVISIPVSFTNSGILKICGSEMVAIVLGVYLLCLLFKEKEKVRENKILVMLCIIYGIYSLVDYGCRIILASFEMKSISVIKADIFAFIVLLILLIKSLDIKKIYIIYSVFFVITAVLLAPTWSKWAYIFYENAAIRLMLLCIQYPVILGYCICAKNKRDKNRLDLIRAAYIFSMLFCYVNIFGGKVNTVAIILSILCGEALIAKKEKRWNFWGVLLPVLLVVLSLMVIYPTSQGVFTRIFWQNTIAIFQQDKEIGKEEKNYEVDETGYIINDQDRFEYYEASGSKDSLHARSEVWKAAWQDIKKNPVFGVGLRQYETTYSTGHSIVILPHNFLLEYMQAVGIIGILIMGFILLWGLISICKTRNTYLLVCYLLLLLVSCMYAFVQPIFCDATVVFIVFINMGVIINLCRRNQYLSLRKKNEEGRKNIRVLVVTCAHMLKTLKGDYYTDSVHDYKFFQRYLRVFDEVEVVARCRVSDELPSGAMKVSVENVLVYELPEFKGLSGLIKESYVLRKLAKNAAQESDCIIYRVPQIESFCIFLFNQYDRPYAVEVVSDPLRWLTGMIKRISVVLLKYMCKNADGASYVTEKYLQKIYPSGKSLMPKSDKFESYYSSVVLDESMMGEEKRYSNISERAFVLVHVANAIENSIKGHYTAIQVVDKLVKAGRNIKIKFIGEGKMTDDLKRTVGELGLQDNVIFTGRIADRQALLDEVQKSDLMLFPTKSEGLPRCIIEAQAVGVPVVSTPVGGIPELLEERYLRQPDDVEGFADLISRLMDHPQELEEMSKSGLENARKYTDRVLTARRSEFYAQLRKRAESKKD